MKIEEKYRVWLDDVERFGGDAHLHYEESHNGGNSWVGLGSNTYIEMWFVRRFINSIVRRKPAVS